jgi:hypothetical protein
LTVGIGLSLLFLNSAVYRAWLASGPPTDNPEGWLFSAWSSLAWAAAAALGGVGIFLLLRKEKHTRAATILLALSALLLAFPWARGFIAMDSCLDAGGSWSKPELRCARAAEHQIFNQTDR